MRNKFATANQPGEEMVLHLSPDNSLPSSLSGLGVRQGELLGKDSALVWVPASKLPAAKAIAGCSLENYAPSSAWLLL